MKLILYAIVSFFVIILLLKKIKNIRNEIKITEDDGYEDYENYLYEDLDFSILKKGFIFEQSAIIEGFESK